METKFVERRMYEKKAQKIVERLSEETVNISTLSSLAQFIEPYHYEEIVEERFLAKLCGYPTCGKELTNIPNQKYRISTISNKVYDITDRKRFCSGDCYKASKYFASKISTVPIWSRNKEEEEEEKKKEVNIKLDEDKLLECNSFGKTLISRSNLYSTEIERELNMIEQEWKSKMTLVDTHVKSDSKNEINVLIKTNVSEHVSVNDEGTIDEVEVKQNKVKNEDNKILNQVANDHVSKYLLSEIFNQTQVEGKFKDKVQLLEYLIRRIEELLSDEAKAYLKNEKNVFDKIQNERERAEFNQKFLNYKSKTEIDNNLDSDDDPDEKENVEEARKPLPFYERLHEEARLEQLKIKEYFNPSMKEDGEPKRDENPIMLPEIDSLSQKQIRQKIFFDKLYKNIESLLKYSSFSNDFELRNHVKNFTYVLNLTNENLIFKSTEMPIVSIIMLEMLSGKFKNLRAILIEDRFIKTILNALNLDYASLQSISSFLISK